MAGGRTGDAALAKSRGAEDDCQKDSNRDRDNDDQQITAGRAHRLFRATIDRLVNVQSTAELLDTAAEALGDNRQP
ncbi:MAG TPA: hypothetical protein VGX76_03805 [Pirellulales bacterium]|nr:hypothetical protein [Pirellulales bacterium]